MPGVVVLNPISIEDISLGTQTHDIKITLDSEEIVLGTGTNTIGKVDLNTLGQKTNTNSLSVVLSSDHSDIKVTLDSEQVDISDRALRDLGQVDVIDIASQGWPFTTDAPITLDGEQVDISNREARDLGKVDIADFDVSLPTGTNQLGKVTLTDGTNDITVTNDSGTYRLEVSAKIAAGGASQDVRLVDNDGDAIAIKDATAVPATSDFGLQIAGPDLADIGRIVNVTRDAEDGKNRLEISGKISVSPPPPPPAATAVQIAADNPLDVSGTHNTDHEITDGKTFTVQSFAAGAEGDPTEKGAKVSLFYIDSSSVLHIISRIYLVGETVQIFPDTSKARDGTSLDGAAGTGTGVIRICRCQFGGGAREIDSVVRGFEE